MRFLCFPKLGISYKAKKEKPQPSRKDQYDTFFHFTLMFFSFTSYQFCSSSAFQVNLLLLLLIHLYGVIL